MSRSPPRSDHRADVTGPAEGEAGRPGVLQRVVLFQFISIMSVMAVYGFISYQVSLSREVRSMTGAVDRIRERLVQGLSLPLWNLDRESADNLLAQEVRDPYVSGIVVYQETGMWTGFVETDDGRTLAIDDPGAAARYLGRSREGPRVQVTHTDPKGNARVVGEVVLFTTDQAIRATLISLMLQTVMQALALVAVLSLFAVIVLDVLLSKPLRQITSTARRIADGEIELQAAVSGPREIATLARTFNTMTSRLRASLEETDRYFATALDLLSISDMDGRLQRLNKEWEATLGYSTEELLGRCLLDLVHPDDMEQTQAEMARLRGREEVLNFVNRLRHKDGSYRWIEWRSFPYGELVYGVARDVTRRRLAEEEIRGLNESLEERVAKRTAELKAINKELESFAYSVAHDLRAPLRAINGFAGILFEDYAGAFDEEGKRVLSVVRDEAMRMDGMIESLLALSRVGRSALNLARVDMADMVRSVVEEIMKSEGRAGIDLRIGELPAATADPLLLRQVWANLLSNAVKFTAKTAQPMIAVEGSVVGGECVYSVRDNGAGFDMSGAERLFGIFQRLHSPREFEGNGIGLALVQRIVLMHGGRVRAEGEVGKGAVFHFSLPQGEEAPVA